MQHILTQCDGPGQSQVWRLANELGKIKIGEEIGPAMGKIMACGTIEKNSAGGSSSSE
jgi:ribonuclease HI